MKKLFFVVVIISLLTAGYLYRDPLFDFLTTNKSGTPKLEQEEMQEPEFRFAVSLDNALPARPQSGLSKADVVFEVPVEGSFTRYLAFFQNKETKKIGPVRSARPYFIDYAVGWDAALVHSGGSREALAELKENPAIKNINEFYNSEYIKRDRSKPGPHNLFTSTDLLAEKAENMNWQKIEQSYGWEIKKDTGSVATSTEQIFINFGNPAFNPSYTYDQAENEYLRFLAGDPHLDELDGNQLTAKNIIVIKTDSSIIDQKLLTVDIRTTGSGRVTVFRDGKAIQARWRKQGIKGPLEFLKADGSAVELNEGPVWIEVLDQKASFSWQ